MTEAPDDLGAPGQKLWQEMHAALTDGTEFDEKDYALLKLACQQQDDIVRLTEALADASVLTEGASGQQRLNALFAEVRQARLALARLLKQLDVGPASRQMTPSEAARHAARARWGARPGPHNIKPRVLPEAK